MSSGVSNILVGILLIAICIPLVMEKVPMNSLYGIRFRKSYMNQKKIGTK